MIIDQLRSWGAEQGMQNELISRSLDEFLAELFEFYADIKADFHYHELRRKAEDDDTDKIPW